MINVLYQFNEKYAPYSGASITSLFENNKDIEITVYILGEGLSQRSVERFKALADRYEQTIVVVDASAVIEDMKTWGMPAYRGSYAANLRLFIPSFIDANVDRILYLDADTIVNGSIKELFDEELGECVIGMAIDSLGNAYKSDYLGLKAGQPYYNSGVILFDLNTWKDEGYSERIIAHIKEGNTSYSSPDQDILNVVVRDRIKTIPPKYNFQPFHIVYPYDVYYSCFGNPDYYSESELISSSRDVRIYHSFRYLGEFPWDKNSIHPYKSMFDRYLMMSPWKDYERVRPESSAAMKLEKILYFILPKKYFFKIFSFVHHRYINKGKETSK